jgi:DNA-binding ferritin-like protein
MNASQNLPWSEQFRIVAKQWVDADAAASILEDTKSAILSERMQALGEMPVSKAEAIVKASPEWREHINEMVNARKVSNRLKVQMEYLRMKFSEWQSHEATKRTEARL